MSVTRAARIFMAHKGVCHICGNQIRDGERWDVEHLRPLWDGGTDDDANLAPAHNACHKGKTAEEAKQRSERNRAITKSFTGRKKRSTFPGSKASKWKRKIDGTVERR